MLLLALFLLSSVVAEDKLVFVQSVREDVDTRRMLKNKYKSLRFGGMETEFRKKLTQLTRTSRTFGECRGERSHRYEYLSVIKFIN